MDCETPTPPLIIVPGSPVGDSVVVLTFVTGFCTNRVALKWSFWGFSAKMTLVIDHTEQPGVFSILMFSLVDKLYRFSYTEEGNNT